MDIDEDMILLSKIIYQKNGYFFEIRRSYYFKRKNRGSISARNQILSNQIR
jgi:hypothetical protein